MMIASIFWATFAALVVYTAGQACNSDGDCPGTTFCDLNALVCLPELGFGAACNRARQCQSGICCTRNSNFFPNCPVQGACASCQRDTDCAPNGGDHVWCNVVGNPPTCVIGTQGVGAFCVKTRECSDGLYCAGNGKCAPVQGKGTTCSSNDQCGPNLYCAFTFPSPTGTCSDAQGFGQSCGGFQPCYNFLQCDINGIADPQCKNLLSPSFSSSACENDLSCGSNGYCNTPEDPLVPSACAPRLGDGTFCTRPRQCASGVCNFGRCVGGTSCPTSFQCPIGRICSNQLCQNPLTLGSPCTQDGECSTNICIVPRVNPSNIRYCMECDFNTRPCGAEFFCDSVNSINRCTPKKRNGAICNDGSECLGGMCSGSICQGGCVTNDDCGAGTYCSNWRCIPYNKKLNGEPCGVSSECQSNLCYNNVCRQPCIVGSASFCPIGTSCQPPGVCLPFSGQLPDGAGCVANSQCRSGFCNLGVCGYRCTSGYSCPPGSVCDAVTGFCTAVTNLPNGASCSVNAQCNSGLCWQGICTAGCSFDWQCQPGFFCDRTTGCCTQARKPNGFPCTNSAQCQSGLCLNSICTQRCIFSSECGLGKVCDFGVCKSGQCGSSQPCPIGFACVNNCCVSVKLPDGSACVNNGQCQSNLCFAGRCQKRCLVTLDCPLGFTCNVVSGLCEWLRKPIGAVCTFDSECLSNFCDSLTHTCTMPCTPGSCPWGWACDVNSKRCMQVKLADWCKCSFDADCTSGICNLGYCGRCQVVGCSLPGYTCDISGRCMRTLLPNGWACTWGADCLSGYCNGGVCGVPCNPNNCPNGFYCSSGSCVTGCTGNGGCPGSSYCFNFRCLSMTAFANGEDCEGDDNCQSSSCVSRSCRSLAPLGGQCSRDDECAKGLACDTSYTFASWGVCATTCKYRDKKTETTSGDYDCPPDYFCNFNPSIMSQPLCQPIKPGYKSSFALGEADVSNAVGMTVMPASVVSVEQSIEYETTVKEAMGLTDGGRRRHRSQ